MSLNTEPLCPGCGQIMMAMQKHVCVSALNTEIDRLRDYEEDVRVLRLQNESLKEFLRMVEWGDEGICPWCEGRNPTHTETCPFTFHLADAEKRKPDKPPPTPMPGPGRPSTHPYS